METILLLTIIVLLLASSDPSDAKIKHMDKKLDQIMDYLGIEDVNIDEELKELIADNKKIPAIKRLRQETGMGLKEAKEYVDNLDEKSF
ncbi:ribosomal protein L7/L12 [Ruoffia tabacinasalis]|jgi:ribosomal protein L7/L12|uniref:ribosomal protein L7/L12 n=1 Tax=Ruoffia tabacinasalis TaxID=87458 RepID=UPI003F956ACC